MQNILLIGMPSSGKSTLGQQLAVGEAEAAAAKRQKEMQGLTAITNSLAYLDTIEFTVVPESGVRTGSLSSNQLDAISDALPQDAPQIEAVLKDTGVPLLHAATMPEAVTISAENAQAGDAVLMSPACASFDMFDNYGHRARVFCEAVQALADDAGQVLGGLS